MLTPKELRYLKTFAHKTSALYQLGKNEIGVNQINLLSKALDARELIKIHLLKAVTLPKEEVAATLCATLTATLIEIKGNNITIFRPKKKDSAFKLPK